MPALPSIFGIVAAVEVLLLSMFDASFVPAFATFFLSEAASPLTGPAVASLNSGVVSAFDFFTSKTTLALDAVENGAVSMFGLATSDTLSIGFPHVETVDFSVAAAKSLAGEDDSIGTIPVWDWDRRSSSLQVVEEPIQFEIDDDAFFNAVYRGIGSAPAPSITAAGVSVTTSNHRPATTTRTSLVGTIASRSPGRFVQFACEMLQKRIPLVRVIPLQVFAELLLWLAYAFLITRIIAPSPDIFEDEVVLPPPRVFAIPVSVLRDIENGIDRSPSKNVMIPEDLPGTHLEPAPSTVATEDNGGFACDIRAPVPGNFEEYSSPENLIEPFTPRSSSEYPSEEVDITEQANTEGFFQDIATPKVDSAIAADGGGHHRQSANTSSVTDISAKDEPDSNPWVEMDLTEQDFTEEDPEPDDNVARDSDTALAVEEEATPRFLPVELSLDSSSDDIGGKPSSTRDDSFEQSVMEDDSGMLNSSTTKEAVDPSLEDSDAERPEPVTTNEQPQEARISGGAITMSAIADDRANDKFTRTQSVLETCSQDAVDTEQISPRITTNTAKLPMQAVSGEMYHSKDCGLAASAWLFCDFELTEQGELNASGELI